MAWVQIPALLLIGCVLLACLCLAFLICKKMVELLRGTSYFINHLGCGSSSGPEKVTTAQVTQGELAVLHGGGWELGRERRRWQMKDRTNEDKYVRWELL